MKEEILASLEKVLANQAKTEASVGEVLHVLSDLAAKLQTLETSVEIAGASAALPAGERKTGGRARPASAKKGSTNAPTNVLIYFKRAVASNTDNARRWISPAIIAQHSASLAKDEADKDMIPSKWWSKMANIAWKTLDQPTKDDVRGCYARSQGNGVVPAASAASTPAAETYEDGAGLGDDLGM